VVGLTAIGTLAHQLEDRLERIREGEKRPSSQEITRLLGAVTEIEKMVAALKGERPAAPLEAPAIGPEALPRVPEAARVADAPPAGAAPETIRTSRTETIRTSSTETIRTSSTETIRTSSTETIRILDADLDRLTRLTNEIHIHHGRLKRMAAALTGAVKAQGSLSPGRAPNLGRQQAGGDIDLLEQQLQGATELSREMTDLIKRMRLVPVERIAHLLEKAVRDLGVETGKKIGFAIEGGALSLDRALLEQVKAPLLHLLRNSVIHGIEAVDERRRQGKAPEGAIKLTFAKDKGGARISCEDDGRGLDAQLIREKAMEKKLIDGAAAAAMTDADALHLVLRSGLSLASDLTQLAGRGVGLDVVKDCVSALGGALEIASAKGRFTRFTMTLPLSIDTMPVFAVRIARQRLLIPMQNMLATRLVAPAQIAHAAGKAVVQFNGAPIPLVPLTELMESETAQAPSRWRRAVIVKADIDMAALAVDAMEGRKEIIPQPLEGPLARIAHLQAAAIMADGDPAFVLDLPGILEKIKALPGQDAAHLKDRPGPVVMVVDDSLTARRLMAGILGAQGYRVVTAGSGDEALEIMGTEQVALFVVDIEMPGLDGFELSARIRGNQRYGATPIIILSTRGSEEDKQKGMAVGANAYFVKGGFDQETFLATVESEIS
jgi:chemotaxis protein histidine kinase CheA/ActR/RegA family two-component response regulator